MAQSYYTLPEAAQVLGVSPMELTEMARKGVLRSFQDRGVVRFRALDVEELARQRGLGSDVDLVLGDTGVGRVASTPVLGSPAPSTPRTGGAIRSNCFPG